jgi:hypothetical protein
MCDAADDPKPDLRDVLRALAQAQARFVVSSGFAMQLHGSSSLTFDLDIAYDRTRENAALLARTLSKCSPRSRGLLEARSLIDGQR